jgi:hypothetical protein
MRKRFGLIITVSISITTILFLASCNGTNSALPTSDTTAAAAKDTTTVPLLPRYNLSGFLDTLWMTADSFKTLTKRVTLRFYIKNPDTLTLQGWSSDNRIYNALPDVILFNSRTSKSAQFGPGNYFGNLQLDLRDIRKIIHQINTTNPVPTFVLFAPQLASSNAGQINYTIFLTIDDPHPLVSIPNPLVTPTGVITNPSPPRNGN